MTKAKPMNALRRRMIDDMTLRNLSPATQRSYLHAVTKFSRHFGCPPDRLGLEDVRSFQVHLVSQGISWPAMNQIVCALRFFFGVTLDRAEIPERIVYARTPRKLPSILSADEVVRFLEAVPSLKTRVALTTAYAAGLRASEAVSLQVADIDSRRMVLQVRHGKGAKDRTVMLSAACWPSYAATGDWHARRHGCSRAAARTSRSMSRSCTPPAARQLRRQDSPSGSASTRCATASPPIFWRAEPTSGSSRSCWATAICRRRRATPMWRPRRSP
jgi:integrase/recombinase XerD